jgi:hypothetical protein
MSYEEPFIVAVWAQGLPEPQHVFIKKYEQFNNKWAILIQDRIFWLALLNLNEFDNEFPAPYTNWPEILEKCREDIVIQTKAVANVRRRATNAAKARTIE